jgi:hypothetical protein
MAIPSIPQSFTAQQGNGQVSLTWSLTAGATSYIVQRSTDGVTYTSLASPTINNYLDTTVSVGTLYYYKVASVNGSGTSPYSAPQSVIPALTGQMSLGEVRLRSQQRADMVNSNFVTTAEWNSYIKQSMYELYDRLVTVYEDYYMAPALVFTTDGSDEYPLPNGGNYLDGSGNPAPACYKLTGVDCGLSQNNNAWVTLQKFDWLDRNKFIYPQVQNTFMGVFNLAYRMIGDRIKFIPTPAGNQYLRLWYIPRLREPLLDTDMLDGISGWTEYVIIDAAIKAMQKEESDVSVLMAQKAAIIARIDGAAQNRDAGQPDVIGDRRSFTSRWGNGFGVNGGGGFAGY